jgi:DNA-binding MarR family transcriptional regulator
MAELTDIEALKALAHPLRQQLLTHLQRHGPATSADLAVEFGADRGATSYHLRQLERFGFIEEDTARSAGRRRYWRAVPQDIRLPRAAADPSVAAAAEEIGRRWFSGSQRTSD